ncbi:MAG: L-fucose/L-arabinose isomerase family protein [Armatimonadota bacterium]|nr:L-fucose/L-arabinose isomerase family protein [Armatimonadota bacterium]MDR7558641.1 L-fucose/L-arabinose isomerase family protein [Armatimonadota bacterium]
MSRTTLGLIVGNRGFFPDHLCERGRQEILQVLAEEAIDVITLDPEQTKLGTVESWEDAKKCAALFRVHREEIAGIVVTLPNFGDERAVADALRLAGLRVPVLVHAFPDEIGQMTIASRRDSFCGKISVCNNLTQYGIPFSLTRQHTVAPQTPAFRRDLREFVATCRVVRGLQGLRVGLVGARPAAFNTVRFSEKLLEGAGISVITLDLSEVLGRIARLGDDSPAVAARLDGIRAYVRTEGIPSSALVKMAKLGVVLDEWMSVNGLRASAIQCWTALEEYLGVVPCTVMSMMSNAMMPSACETDVAGVVAMYALQLAANQPSAIVDWNNNYKDDPNRAVIFHCSNLPLTMFEEATMSYQEIIAGTVGRENTFGTIVGRLRPGPLTFCRFSTDDRAGTIAGYIGEGRVVEEFLQTFGGYAVVEIPEMQDLLRFICRNGFEHHVAVTLASVAGPVYEATTRYLGWRIHRHGGSVGGH